MQEGFIDNNVGEKMISSFATKTKTQVKSSCNMLHQHIVVVHMVDVIGHSHVCCPLSSCSLPPSLPHFSVLNLPFNFILR